MARLFAAPAILYPRSSILVLLLRLPAAPRQVFAEVGLEGRDAAFGPGALDGLDDLLVLFHQVAEGLVLGRSGRGADVAVVAVGAEEVAAAVGARLDPQLHVRVVAVAQPHAVALALGL